MNLVRVLALNVLNTKFLIFSAHTKKEKKKKKKRKKTLLHQMCQIPKKV